MEGIVTTVIERQAASELSVAAAATDTAIAVVAPDEFDADGGVLLVGDPNGNNDICAYSIDTDTGVVTLKTPLANSYSDGDPVAVYPAFTERVAFFREAGSGEELEARVPHGLYDRIATGTRDEDSAELIECEMRGHELVVSDIVGRQLANYAEALDADNTVSTTAVELGGPAVTLTVPQAGLVSVFASVDIKANGSGGQGAVVLYLDGVPLGEILESVAVVFQTLMTTTGAITAGFAPVTSALTFPVEAGQHTFELRYFRTGGTSADFRNRKLWAWLVGQ